MDIIKIEELDLYRKNNPDIKDVLVDHGQYGFVELRFNWINKEDVSHSPFCQGQYDAFGTLYFVDDEGTLHKCYKHGSIRPLTMK